MSLNKGVLRDLSILSIVNFRAFAGKLININPSPPNDEPINFNNHTKKRKPRLDFRFLFYSLIKFKEL